MPTRARSKSSTRQRDIRGNVIDRAARRLWLLRTFDPELGTEHAFCSLSMSEDCLVIVDIRTLSVDRKQPGGSYRRDNIQPACQPCQSHQGGLIGTERTKEERHGTAQGAHQRRDGGARHV